MIIVFAKKEKSNDRLENTIELLAKIKDELKNSEIAKQICGKYGYEIDIIDGIPIEFIDGLDSSAKTINSKIQINDELMDAPFEKVMRYAIHELTHALQHMQRYGKEDPHSGKEYLDRGDEIEAFQFQVEYESENVGKNEAETYVDELLEYHEIPEEDREDKKEELMNRVD